MNQSQILVDQNNQYVVSTTPSGLNNSASSSSASSTPSSSCSSGHRPQTIIANDFDFLECTNTINLVDKNLMNLNMMEFHNLNQNGQGTAASADMVEEYWCANFNNQQCMSQSSYGAEALGAGGGSQVVMMPPPATMPSSSSTPSSSASSPTPSAPKRGAARSRKKPAPLDPCAELNAPKPPLTGYQHYFKERQCELRSQDASLKFADIVKKVGTDWSKNIDKETKNKFIIKGLQDKERYKQELKVYQSSVSEAAGSPKSCKKASEPDECKLAHLHTPPPSNDSSSPASLSPGHWLTDCCLLAHKDYFNVDAYHSKIIERCLLTQHEIKYLKQKLHQFKAEHKKLGHLFKSCKSDLDKKHGHVTDLATTNASLKSQLGLFKSLVHSCLLSPLSVYQNQSPSGATQYQMAYAPPAHTYHQYSGQSPPQHQHYYLMDSASVYNQQIQLQLQQNQYPGQYYANSVYVQQQQQQQYAANGEVYQEGWMAGQARTAYDDAAQYGQYMQQQQQQQQVYQQQQAAPNQSSNSLQASTTS